MPKSASFRFYGGLNDFLPIERRNSWFSYSFWGTPSIKNAIEAIGPPHPEVDLVLVNDVPVKFSYLLQKGDRIEVHPLLNGGFFSKNDEQVSNKFILDVHLGKLARSLRLLGFDTTYDNFYEDETIVKTAKAENRIVLTRDLLLLKNGDVARGYWIRSQHSEEQLKEVIRYFNLSKFKPFKRCLECNGIIKKNT
ncbi:Mut7-C ubiquitin/RNAse domain-containing protein [Solitalea koreensis]|uniref:Twitching motility protein PilT n=1 Tax=Solitalea koreensis TaxID=543615 RepID=A0A521DXQ0_9SPHI|nr:Mut7-C ubiquitin/RNAse domain-containing protein [Solitalea koreensis]SMO76415.1 hypothetical protein SAMN06265350_10946 [Solitalea koreensis]